MPKLINPVTEDGLYTKPWYGGQGEWHAQALAWSGATVSLKWRKNEDDDPDLDVPLGSANQSISSNGGGTFAACYGFLVFDVSGVTTEEIILHYGKAQP